MNIYIYIHIYAYMYIYIHMYTYTYKVFKVNPYLKYFGRCLLQSLQSLYKCHKFTY